MLLISKSCEFENKESYENIGNKVDPVNGIGTDPYYNIDGDYLAQ